MMHAMEAPHPNERPAASLPADLRRPTVPSHVREWVRDATGLTVRRVVRLVGASSAALHRLEMSDGSAIVLRRYVWRAYLAAEPDAPAREVEAIAFARRHGLPVPELVAHDVTGEAVGDGVPVVLMTLLPGRALAVPDLRNLAEAAASVHGIDADDLDQEYSPWYEEEMTTPPPLTARPALWETAIDLWRGGLPPHRRTFIHRDFHPGNLLWVGGRLSGIVDWASACRGPVGCDVAHCRANLRHLAGQPTADRFVAEYEGLTGVELDPFWVMASHLEHDHAHWTLERLAADEPDLERAVRQLTDAP